MEHVEQSPTLNSELLDRPQGIRIVHKAAVAVVIFRKTWIVLSDIPAAVQVLPGVADRALYHVTFFSSKAALTENVLSRLRQRACLFGNLPCRLCKMFFALHEISSLSREERKRAFVGV